MEENMRYYKKYINGEWRDSDKRNPILDKYTQSLYAEYAVTTAADVDEAVAAAKKSFIENPLNGTQRYEILMKAKELLMAERDEIADMICHEAGRRLEDAAFEVNRAIITFDLAAEEARRICGHMVPTLGQPGHEDKLCYTILKPKGVVAIIMPFNLPLILTANKLAPAIAAGNTVVLKPTQVCPGYAVKLVEVLLKAGLPKNHIQLILGRGSEAGEALLKNQDVAFYCFTGSKDGGIHVRNTIGLRKASMDLGNNSPVVVWKDVDVKAVAGNCAGYGFYNAGQVCFRPQRLYVHKDIFEEFCAEIKAFCENCGVGDPTKPETYVGPMISPEDVTRVDEWVKEAVAQGATLVAGGEKYCDTVYRPTLLTNVTRDMKVVKDEIFGPVLVAVPFEKIEDAFAMANDSEYGLHSACFTNDLNIALAATEALEAGGVIINESSATHVPNSPFGGIKNSGAGDKESPYGTIREMSDEKTIVIKMEQVISPENAEGRFSKL